jgi:dihydropteroate synthase
MINKNIFNSMGVINITPNSFSDGNKFKNYTQFRDYFIDMLSWADVIDIGAESTAPFNSAIDSLDELERFEEFLFPLVSELNDPHMYLSIDTYKPEVFYEVYLVVKHYWPNTHLIFNDVSGKIDDELALILSDTNLDFDYIYSHNLCVNRSMTSDHMKFCSKEKSYNFLNEMVKYFRLGLEILGPLTFNRKVWIDPCFGFSKSRQQNQFLLKNIQYFLEGIPTNISLVYGISRKSFLRVPADLDPKDTTNIEMFDQMQTVFIYELLKNSIDREFLFRVHTVLSLKSAINIISIVE